MEKKHGFTVQKSFFTIHGQQISCFEYTLPSLSLPPRKSVSLLVGETVLEIQYISLIVIYYLCIVFLFKSFYKMKF